MTPEEQWILNELKTEHEVSCVNSSFMYRFMKAFPKRKRKIYPLLHLFYSPMAMEVIKRLYKQGKLKRQSVGLPGMGPGWPRWVWSYSLP